MSIPYLEIDIKLSLFARIPIHWHALILNTFGITVFYYFACEFKHTLKSKKAVFIKHNLELHLKNRENIVPKLILFNYLAMS